MQRQSHEPRRAWRTAALYAAASASLALMIATVLAWTWLGRYERSVVYATRNAQIQVGAFPKAIIFDRSVVTWSLRPGWETSEGNFSIPVDVKQVGRETGTQVRLHTLGGAAVRTITRTFRNKTGGPPHQRTELGLWIPYWLLMLVSAPLPLWVVTIHRSRRVRAARRARGLCEDCGYDLRATPGRCPECGADAKPSLLARLTSLFTRPLQQRLCLDLPRGVNRSDW